MSDNMIACCGLNCSKCDAYLATLNNDDELRKKTAESWSVLNNCTITPEMINCTGCRAEGAKTPFCESICGIRKCAVEKNYLTCAECSNLGSCETLSAITANNPEAAAALGIAADAQVEKVSQRLIEQNLEAYSELAK